MAISTGAFAQTQSAGPDYPDVKLVPVQNAAAKPTADVQHELSANLQEAGFTDVTIVPEAFIVQAKTKAGDRVTRFRSPDALTIFTAQDARGEASKTAPSTPPDNAMSK